MTFIVRHSERIDYAFPNCWKKTLRYSQNRRDPYITNAGIDIAKKAAIKILKSIYKDKLKIPDYIYCSPFTRCVETAIVISTLIEIYTDKKMRIRIENGLRECYINPIWYASLMDKHLTLKGIQRRFSKHRLRFDFKYTPIHSFEEMSYNSLNPITELKRPLDVISKIHNNNDGLVCTHGLNLLTLYTVTTNNKLSTFTENKKLTGSNIDSYCSILKLPH